MRLELKRVDNRWRLIRLSARVLPIMILVGVVFIAGGLIGALTYREGVRPSTAPGVYVNWVQDQLGTARAVITAPDAEPLVLDIGFTEFEQIRAKRQSSIDANGIFASDADLVQATLTFMGQTHPVKIRLKGDLLDHILTDKWSYRIELSGDDRVGGMKRFSIQRPEVRGFTYEQAFLETLRYENVLAPRYDFIDVTINGESLGHYALEEFMGKELLESQNRRPGVIFGFDEDYFWKHIRQTPATPALGFGLLDQSYTGIFANINLFDEGRVNKDPELRAQADVLIANIQAFQEGLVTGAEIFDVERMATYLAVVELWQAEHAFFPNNLRLYYNPVSGLIEPVGFDGEPVQTVRETVFGRSEFVPSLIAKLVDEPEFAAALMSELTRLTAPSYMDELRTAIGPKIDRSVAILRKEFSDIESPWTTVEGRQILLRKIINPALTGVAYAQFEPADMDGVVTLELSIANVLSSLIEVTGVRISPTVPTSPDAALEPPSTLAFESGRIIKNRQTLEDPLIFETLTVSLEDTIADAVRLGADVELLGHILGQNEERTMPVTVLSSLAGVGREDPVVVTRDDAVAAHPFLELGSDPTTLSVMPGVWDVTGDLVLPDAVGLSITAGTTLRFERGGALIGSGPLVFEGTAEEPVVLEPQAESWEGILMQRSGASSSWRHTIVRNTTGFQIPGRAITGGVTFNESPLILRDVLFEGSTAEDALNVILASIDFDDVRFSGTASDAFDGDAVTGRISDTGFIGIAGDGVDFSASDVVGSNLTFFDIGDKAVSAGEGSSVQISNLTVDTASIGVASKDMSGVEITGGRFDNIRNYTFASYQKKSEYGPATLTASSTTIAPGSLAMLVEQGSELNVNGSKIETQAVDIADLYDAGILGSLN